MLPTKSPLGIRGAYSGSTAGVINFTIRAKPLPETVTRFLQTNVSILKRLRRDVQAQTPENKGGVSGTHSDVTGDLEAETEDVRRVVDGELARTPSVSLEEFWPSLEELLDAAGSEWQGLTPSVWSFGPNHIGPNILFHRTGSPPNSFVF
jgi:ribosome assembly protein 1